MTNEDRNIDLFELADELIALSNYVRCAAEASDAICVEEAAKILNCAPRTVRHYVQQGKFKRLRQGARIWLSRAAVTKYVNKGKV